MKECLRIFTEFTESKACRETTKQASGKQMEFEMLYYQNISGPKKRIAHIAKFDAKIEEKAIYERCGSRNMYVNIAINTLKLRHQALTGIILYRHLKDYLLTEEQLHENNYPQPNPDKPGSILFTSGMTKALVNDTSRKICCRCGKIHGVTPTGKHSRVEECNYHLGPVLSHKVLGGLETWYSCCEGVVGSAGCQVAKLHVHDWKENIEGFMKTFVKCPPADGNPGVFAVNCEVLIHTSVVDTTVLFPHWLGLPHKRSLKSLVADHLQRIIQDNGHSSSESAAACMELVLWKVKEDLKGKK
ncbi:RNA exonuclease 1 homolog [Callorhinus ursinus]|uniref:RNA exonuclease 1 homolog n=1 Tax=Callorhinus ursinus TaxID=34884 RepID=UPI003CD04773